MWALDPKIRDYVGEARDYAYDWNTPGGVPGSGPVPWQDIEGLRRRVRVQLPALVAVHPLASATPRYAYARMREGRVVPIASNAPVDNDYSAWTLTRVAAKPKRLAAPEKRSGHARMLSAMTTESRGGSVVIEGSSVEKAQVILAYLREHQLVDY